jgi:hypothetical protein
MTMLATGTSGMSVHRIEDAVLHMLSMLQQRLGVFSGTLEEMQQNLNCERWIYQPQQAIPSRGYTMPVAYVSRGEMD